MSTRLKLTDSIVINADEIVELVASGVSAVVRTTITYVKDAGVWNQFIINTGSAAQAAALIKAIEKALTASPSGRVIVVPASSDYTITTFYLESEY